MSLRLLCIATFVCLLALGCGRRRVNYQPTGPQVAGQQGWAQPRIAQPGQAVTPQDGWMWAEINPRGLGLACRMPATPRYEQRIGREDDGAFYRSGSARVTVPYGNFGVIVTEWEGGIVGDPLDAAHDLANTVFSEQQLTERRSKRLDVAGFYGREDTGVGPNGAFVALRQFVGARRIYVAFAIVARAHGPLGSAEAFMSSIRLDTGDAIFPVGGSSERASAIFVPETDFAVRMPPLSSRRTEDLTIGDYTLTTHSFVAETPGARLRVRVIDLPERADLEVVQEITQGLALGQLGAPVSASGFPGNAFTRTSGNVAIDGRLFITASRMYVIEAARPSTQPASALAREFFESFRIL